MEINNFLCESYDIMMNVLETDNQIYLLCNNSKFINEEVIYEQNIIITIFEKIKEIGSKILEYLGKFKSFVFGLFTGASAGSASSIQSSTSKAVENFKESQKKIIKQQEECITKAKETEEKLNKVLSGNSNNSGSTALAVIRNPVKEEQARQLSKQIESKKNEMRSVLNEFDKDFSVDAILKGVSYLDDKAYNEVFARGDKLKNFLDKYGIEYEPQEYDTNINYRGIFRLINSTAIISEINSTNSYIQHDIKMLATKKGYLDNDTQDDIDNDAKSLKDKVDKFIDEMEQLSNTPSAANSHVIGDCIKLLTNLSDSINRFDKNIKNTNAMVDRTITSLRKPQITDTQTLYDYAAKIAKSYSILQTSITRYGNEVAKLFNSAIRDKRRIFDLQIIEVGKARSKLSRKYISEIDQLQNKLNSFLQ